MWKSAKDTDRFAGLHEKSFVILESLKRSHDRMKSFPTARRPPGPAIHGQLARIFRDVFVEVVHQHPHGGFLMPTFAGDRLASWCSYRCVFHIIESLSLWERVARSAG